MDGLERAIDIADGQSGLARLLGISPQAVQQWVAKRSIPPARAIQVEAVTGGRVTRAQLRPDLWGRDDEAA